MAIVVFSKIEPIAMEMINVTISIVSKLIPISKTASTAQIVITVILTRKMPPINSRFAELLFVKGTSDAISFPIQAVG